MREAGLVDIIFFQKAFPSPNNGAIHNVAEIIKAVMSSAAEAETGGLYINARKAVEIRNILEEMGHKQPPTPGGHRQQSRTAQAYESDGHAFSLATRPGKPKTIPILLETRHNKQGDYFTKHHPVSHHRNMRPEILTPYKVLMALRKLQGMSGGRATNTTARVY
eukprot:CCRYP_014620-RA/>CCRYP_014620-RA protein AED:0.46 eAED:0.45 QI:0/0/0/1/0/0/2/0/163